MPIRPCYVGDGVDDDIAVTDHSSIQNIFAGGGFIDIWAQIRGASDANPTLAAKSDVATKGWYWYFADTSGFTDRGSPVFGIFRAGGLALWAANIIQSYTDFSIHNWKLSYDSDSVSNDPVFFRDGVDVGATELMAPSGAAVSDAGQNLSIGSIFPAIGLQVLKGRLWNFGINTAGTISAANALLDWQTNNLADSSFAARYKLNETNFPTDNAANSGSGGAGAGSVVGATTEHAYTRFA